MKKTIFATLVLLALSVVPAFAQLSAGVYGGVATNSTTFSGMVMADYGTKFDVEPWLQTFAKEVQLGIDVIVSPDVLKGFGVTVGGYSNTATARFGVTYSFKNGQVRIMRTNDGVVQAIGLYNFNLTPTTYLQVWLAPAQGSSSYLVGVGHVFKP